MVKMNYYNNDKFKSSPFKRGKFKDIIKPKKNKYVRVSYKSDKEVIDALVIDLVQILADIGIHLKNVRVIAKGLVRLGWVRRRKIVRNDNGE